MYKLAIRVDENGLSDGNTGYKIKWEKAIEQELVCNFIRIDPGKEDFDIFKTINETFRNIKQSTKERLINKISKKLLWWMFKSEP